MKVFKHIKVISIKNGTFNLPGNIFLFNNRKNGMLAGPILYKSLVRRCHKKWQNQNFHTNNMV